MRLATWRVGQQDVLGFQVSVDDSFGLEDAHGPCDLQQEDPDGVLAQRSFTCTGEHPRLVTIQDDGSIFDAFVSYCGGSQPGRRRCSTEKQNTDFLQPRTPQQSIFQCLREH